MWDRRRETALSSATSRHVSGEALKRNGTTDRKKLRSSRPSAAIGSRNFTNQCHAGEPENWSQRSWNYSPILLHTCSYGALNARPSVIRLLFSAAEQITCWYYVNLLLYNRPVSNEMYKSTALCVVFICSDNNINTFTHEKWRVKEIITQWRASK